MMRTAISSSTSARRARYATALHPRCLPTPHHRLHIRPTPASTCFRRAHHRCQRSHFGSAHRPSFFGSAAPPQCPSVGISLGLLRGDLVRSGSLRDPCAGIPLICLGRDPSKCPSVRILRDPSKCPSVRLLAVRLLEARSGFSRPTPGLDAFSASASPRC